MRSDYQTWADSLFVPINPEGWRFIPLFVLAAIALFWIWAPLGWLGAAAAVWCVFFFRDPERVVPTRAGLVVSPADGVVQSVVEAPPPAELAMGDAPVWRISVFMNVFNVHVNRVPVAGRIVDQAYTPGQFFNASLDKASVFNERMSIRLALADGREMAVVQIAGLVARRIRCDLVNDQIVATGERFGLIRFGSRVDVYLPAGIAPLVMAGQTMIAGETVLAEIPVETAAAPDQ
jgi:phosphatidylserine decarboxylase